MPAMSWDGASVVVTTLRILDDPVQAFQGVIVWST